MVRRLSRLHSYLLLGGAISTVTAVRLTTTTTTTRQQVVRSRGSDAMSVEACRLVRLHSVGGHELEGEEALQKLLLDAENHQKVPGSHSAAGGEDTTTTSSNGCVVDGISRNRSSSSSSSSIHQVSSTTTTIGEQQQQQRPHQFPTTSGRGADEGGVVVPYDYLVIGGGIVGLAVAAEIAKRHRRRRGKGPEEERAGQKSISICLVEKESTVAQHQSGHNSGVIHAGIYYPVGSLISRLCLRGQELMYQYCEAHGLPYSRCGKLIVANGPEEIQVLRTLYERGKRNGVEGLNILTTDEEVGRVEPVLVGHQGGKQKWEMGRREALWSPNTGIADYAAVTRHLLRGLHEEQHQPGFSGQEQEEEQPARPPCPVSFQSVFNFEAQHICRVIYSSDKKQQQASATDTSADTRRRFCSVDDKSSLYLVSGVCDPRKFPDPNAPKRAFLAKNVITCCGLHNDIIAAASEEEGHEVTNTATSNPSRRKTMTPRHATERATSLSFRGRYWQLTPEAQQKHFPIRTNIYPVPIPGGIPVGVHFTPTCNEERGKGRIIVGPGSALCLAREGYSTWDFSWDYMWKEILTSSSARSFLWQNGFVGLKQMWVDVSKRHFLREAQKLIPDIRDEDLEPAMSGVMSLALPGKQGRSKNSWPWERRGDSIGEEDDVSSCSTTVNASGLSMFSSVDPIVESIVSPSSSLPVESSATAAGSRSGGRGDRGVVVEAHIPTYLRVPLGVSAENCEQKDGTAMNQQRAAAFDSAARDDDHSCAAGVLLHVRNAPSPCATSAFALAEYIVDVSEKGVVQDLCE